MVLRGAGAHSTNQSQFVERGRTQIVDDAPDVRDSSSDIGAQFVQEHLGGFLARKEQVAYGSDLQAEASERRA